MSTSPDQRTPPPLSQTPRGLVYGRQFDASASLPSLVAGTLESSNTSNNLDKRSRKKDLRRIVFHRSSVPGVMEALFPASDPKKWSPTQIPGTTEDEDDQDSRKSIDSLNGDRGSLSRSPEPSSPRGRGWPSRRPHSPPAAEETPPGSRPASLTRGRRRRGKGARALLTSISPTRSLSRATSPFQYKRARRKLSSGQHDNCPKEEPFIPVNPFGTRIRIRLPRFSYFSDPKARDVEKGALDLSTHRGDDYSIRAFLTATLPREVYLNLLLHLPAMYFSRVERIFRDAEVSKPDIEKLIDDANEAGSGDGVGRDKHDSPVKSQTSWASLEHTPPEDTSPALIRFKRSWQTFVDSLLREWKTLNVVSALLLSAILTLFQIPGASGDPLTRSTALLSLMFALMSLLYGCMYIVRFGTMRTMHRASRWAEEARKADTSIWWNAWVLLAMPIVWISWSMILFIISILSFVWRTGSVHDPPERPPLSGPAALAFRIVITGVFVLGMVYFGLIVTTLTKYGVHTRQRNAQQADPERRGRRKKWQRLLRKKKPGVTAAEDDSMTKAEDPSSGAVLSRSNSV